MTEHHEDTLWPHVPHWRPIPELFHSLGADGPFQQCEGCGVDFADPDVRYVIERIFRGSEPIVEIAMCLSCQDDLSGELSEESLVRISDWFGTLDHAGRLLRLRQHLDSPDVTPWVERCVVTGKSRDDCRGYQVVALCRGPQLELTNLPLMLSDDAAEALGHLLSRKTRETMEDFLGDRFGMPPEFCQSPDFFPVLL